MRGIVAETRVPLAVRATSWKGDTDPKTKMRRLLDMLDSTAPRVKAYCIMLIMSSGEVYHGPEITSVQFQHSGCEVIITSETWILLGPFELAAIALTTPERMLVSRRVFPFVIPEGEQKQFTLRANWGLNR